MSSKTRRRRPRRRQRLGRRQSSTFVGCVMGIVSLAAVATSHYGAIQLLQCNGFSLSKPTVTSLTARPFHITSKMYSMMRSKMHSTRRGTYYDDDDDQYDDERDETGRRGNYYDDDGKDSENWDRNQGRQDANEGQMAPDDGNDDDTPRGGYYRVYFNDEVDPAETELDWESCSDGNTEALVLLPPAAVERPTAIVHFVGGTFFGSAPKLWYRTFLESIVRNTQAAVVVTPIPVTLFQSPLEHVQLTQKLQRAFEMAWYSVLEDEYGQETLQSIPLCGIGHSLGARLLTVLTTMNRNRPSSSLTSSSSSPRSKRQQQQDRIPPYKSMCLISFTNYGASAGIPGVAALLRQSKREEQVTKVNGERQRYKRAREARNDWQLDDDNEYDPYDEEYTYRNKRGRNQENGDEEWSEIVDELSELVKEQASRVRTALTPKSKDLEFFPSPEQLWKAIRDDRRYAVNETLLVQFDNDPVDQSSKLAQILFDTNSSDVKFARLRGTHLTPVTAVLEGGSSEGGAVANGQRGGWLDLPSRASTTIWKAIRGKSKTQGQEAAMRELRQSVVAYITEVVTK